MVQDYAGYDELLELARSREVGTLPGDIVEIGAYMGGGTVKLARFAQTCRKRVFAIDTFDPELDLTLSPKGVSAGEVYQAFLEGASVLEVFQESVRGFKNVVTVVANSRKVTFPPAQQFCLGYIDGCHSYDFILSDFALIWKRLVPRGILAFHDYAFGDWPEVTTAVNEILVKEKNSISEVLEIEDRNRIKSKVLIKS